MQNCDCLIVPYLCYLASRIPFDLASKYRIPVRKRDVRRCNSKLTFISYLSEGPFLALHNKKVAQITLGVTEVTTAWSNLWGPVPV